MLLDRIFAHARAHPGRTAFITGGVAIDYATFARAIAALRGHLAASALPATGLAVIRTERLADSWATMIALRSLGLDTIGVTSLAVAADLKLKDVICVVARQEELAKGELEAPAVSGKPFVFLPHRLWQDSLAGEPPQADGSPRPAGGHILFTSGTTGMAKKILVSADIDERRFARNAAVLGWPANPVVYVGPLNLGSATGYSYTSFGWHIGACVVFDQGSEPAQRFFEHPLTNAFLNPVQARQLVAKAREANQEPGDVEIRVSGAAVPLDLVEALKRNVSRNIIAHFSATECLVVMGTRMRSLEDIQWYTPFPDRIVEIVDGIGRARPDGKEGELRIRLIDSDCTSYLDDPDTTAKFFRDGWFHTGDFAVRRADGRVRLLGRLADVLNIGGSKVAVAPIEQQLQQALRVDNVCLFSQLTDAGADVLAVAYEAASDLPAARMDALARQFPAFSHLRFVRFGAFPQVGGLQKIDRRALRRAIFGRPKLGDGGG